MSEKNEKREAQHGTKFLEKLCKSIGWDSCRKGELWLDESGDNSRKLLRCFTLVA